MNPAEVKEWSKKMAMLNLNNPKNQATDKPQRPAIMKAVITHQFYDWLVANGHEKKYETIMQLREKYEATRPRPEPKFYYAQFSIEELQSRRQKLAEQTARIEAALQAKA